MPGQRSSLASSAVLPKVRQWHPQQGEVEPWIKTRATRLLELAGNWHSGSEGLDAARQRIQAAGFEPNLADALSSLLQAGSSAVLQVRDAQYGGILSTSASVIVVVDQWRLLSDGSLQTGGTTLDIRLTKSSPHWRVVEVLPAHPTGASTQISSPAQQVLQQSRIRLPYAAKADVLSGGIHDSVLKMLLRLSAIHVVDVSVMRSGHPHNVFGTSRKSDHTIGRAVDIWALDSKPLVLPTNHTLAANAMRLAVAHGAYNVGGPILISGTQYFSDRTHQDHIHLGFNY
ncbi:MAG TPA: hypothetical protein VMV52_01385 [Candidatus Nanopelagicaceae bacterium]|nr:hypothetical protein [Candidatus Nanopelagicaceae bacterium]